MDILSYVMGQKSVNASGGGGGLGIDIPIFAATYDSEWEELQSITCNKTLAECYEIFKNEQQTMALLIEKAEGDDNDYYSGPCVYSTGTDGTNPTLIKYVIPPYANADIVYTTTGIELVVPSGFPDELTATENGEYEASTIYKTVTVAVP